MKLRFLRPARLEMFRASDWYDGGKAGLGDEFLDEVTGTLARIKQFPQAHPPTKLSCRKAKLSRFPFDVVYRASEAEIVIFAVAHQKRRPDYWIQRRA
jgi:hypothetical protein